ncbi:neuronal acetylcholine receptor subunit alpha-6-like [Convolutriloba macropyga]|uniref:neuronal acetylcholine receptor subunit alpha-6-like n=1 Tax=Convolutriloba macropyga TaxID=536237 RepID=UPI003F524382
MTITCALSAHQNQPLKSSTKVLFTSCCLLQWDPAEYDGIEILRYDRLSIWTPDILPYNDVGTHDQEKYDFTIPLLARYTGEVNWHRPVNFETTCSLDVTNFPFDTQTCTIEIGSWQYNKSDVNVSCLKQADRDFFVNDSLWDLESVECKDISHEYTNGIFGLVHLTVIFKRLSKFYVQNLILPNAVLLSLCTLTFFIPGEIGEKVSFGVTVTLALCVNLMIVTDFVPQTSKTFPKICTYFLLSIVLSCLSLLIATLSINVKPKQIQEKTYEISTLTSQNGYASHERNGSSLPGEIEDKNSYIQRQAIKLLSKITRKRLDMLLGVIYLTGTLLFTLLFVNSMIN